MTRPPKAIDFNFGPCPTKLGDALYDYIRKVEDAYHTENDRLFEQRPKEKRYPAGQFDFERCEKQTGARTIDLIGKGDAKFERYYAGKPEGSWGSVLSRGEAYCEFLRWRKREAEQAREERKAQRELREHGCPHCGRGPE